ncbi:MAG: hypothetical protein K2X50_07210 [Gammaproteobacteria bacterium]|nr:hypothetical protein [Gammaproteobacteria bacterium]
MMKRLVEEYLIELMKSFNEFGILGPDGQPFKPEEFLAGGNFNYEALQLFELGEEQPINLKDRLESHQNFYVLLCDDLESAMNEDPLLKAAIEDKTLGWINVDTNNENQYPIKALKAMWNHILHPNKVLNSNASYFTIGRTLLGLQPFLRYHAGYLDDSATTNPEVRYYGAPRIVDKRTLAFSKKALALFDKIINLEKPLEAVYEMIGAVSRVIPQKYFDKMVATYKEAHRELNVRIPRFEESLAKAPTQEELESLLTNMNELKQPAQAAIDKYYPYFNFSISIQKQISAFEARHPNATNEEKTPFYTSLLDQFTEFEGKTAPTAEEIEADLQILAPIRFELAEKMMALLGKEKNVHYLNKELLKAIYIVLSTPDLLEKYKPTIADMQLNLHETKRQIQMRLGDVTVVGKTTKLIEDKKAALRAIHNLQNNIRLNEVTKTTLIQNIDLAKLKHADFIANTENERTELNERISAFDRTMATLTHDMRLFYDLIDSLQSKAWDHNIAEDITPTLVQQLGWTQQVEAEWRQKDADYEKWKQSNIKSEDNGSLTGFLSRNISHYSHYALSTIVSRTPRQALIAEIQTRINELDVIYEEDRDSLFALMMTLHELEAPGVEILAHQQRLQTEADSNSARIDEIGEEIAAENTKIGQCSNEFKELLNQCTIKLNAIITQSKNDLSLLQIGPATIIRLKSIFENTARDIGKIKEEYDVTVQACENNFASDEIDTAKKQFEDQYSLFEQNQIKLLKSMTTMSEQLVTDYKLGITENDPEAQKNQHIIVLATQLKDLALTYLPQEKTLAEKIQAKENFEKACAQELYSNNAKIAVGVVVGILSTIVLCAAITAALALFFAGGGWLAFMIGAPILAKAGVTAAASSIAIGGSIVGAAVGEHLDEKYSQEYFEQWRFFYENVDQVAKETCKETPAISLPNKI